jgi:hypothetical protein
LILLTRTRHATHCNVYPTHFFIRAGAASKRCGREEIIPSGFPVDHDVNRRG